MAAQRFKQTAAAEIMGSAGDKIISKSVSCIKMCSERLIGSIDRDKYALSFKISLDDALLICQDRHFQISVAECFAFAVCMCKAPDQRCQVIFFRLLKAWP